MPEGATPIASTAGPAARPDLLRAGAVHLPGPDGAAPSHYGAPLREQRRLLARRAVVDLNGLEVLEVSGADHRTWLTTVSSQVLTDLAPGDSRTLAVLSPQGRVEHLAQVVVPQADPAASVLLVTDPGARSGLRRYLESMRFAARVEITDRDDLRVLGALAPAAEVLATSEAGALLPAPVGVWSDPWPAVAPGGVAYGPDPEEATPWVLTLLPADALAELPWRAEDLAGTEAAEALRIASHRPRLVTEVDERTIPHEIDLLRTAVHTAKGCYRGQETVAKVLNLGQPPRRLVMLHLDGSQDVPAARGATVHLGAKQVGVVTSAAVHADLGPIALAVIKRAVPIDATLGVRVPLTGGQDDGAEAQDVPVLELDAAQEPAVLEREHGARPSTARLGTAGH